jgi:16S rRNA (cytosine1402-N4)-methyltransferase
VLVAEVIELLQPGRGGTYVDCTLGLGGHARALLEAGADRVIGLDRDQDALAGARRAMNDAGARLDAVHADFKTLGAVLDARGLALVDGILADLGVSSLQLDGAGRGFSFRRDEPLDMRMDRTTGPTAADFVNGARETELADVIYRFGEERYSRRIARAIVAARPIRTTGELATLVRRAVHASRWQRIDPATRTFQALRIRVNGELDGLDTFLAEASGRLAPGGRLAVITFHSLEDRIVKHTMRALAAEPAGLRVLTKKPVIPGEAEVLRNPRARSAKLRAIAREAA